MKFVKILIFILLAIALQRFCHNQTDGFAMRKIMSDLSYNPQWVVEEPSNVQEIKEALSQPYRYLSKGAQSYVFASDDGKYVLKFFRHDHMRKEPWHYLLTKENRSERQRAAEDKLFKDFASYKLAYNELKNETGLVYVHLNKTDHLSIDIPLYDKIGVQHHIALDRMEFILQKRAQLIFPALQEWIQANDIKAAKGALTELVNLLKERFTKEIYDKDPDLNTNFGFLGQHPVQIDVGRFKKDPFYSNRQVYQREIARITDNLKQWLDLNSPELSEHLLGEVHKL